MGFLIFLVICFFIVFFVSYNFNDFNKKNKEEKEQEYIKPELNELTKEQIDIIHSHGKITPAEKVKEWESFGLCAPGDAIGSAAWRCKKFKNCHDCLIDYANSKCEYSSIVDDLKIICK